MRRSRKHHADVHTKQFLLTDQYYRACILESLRSKGELQRYGSILVKNNSLIGRGYNRLITPQDRIRQGYANHAEINAINDCLRRRKNPEGSILYVAGFFAKERMLCLRDEPSYTCMRCIPGMQEYGIRALAVPTLAGWVTIPLDEIPDVVRHFQTHATGANTHERRLSTWKNPYSIDFLLERVHFLHQGT